MPEQRDRDQLDRERPLVDDEARGEAEEFEDVDEGDEDEAEAEDEDELDAGER